ncbi:hypothetical protein [Microvirga massiliensis]|uniref:hypothetical protein n=1 Tax=Microvirga massiliensis TaxID=1033741 RepID=UPI000A72EA86|nr:hypothetical protein [Microvirga massiliensis]
MQYCQTVSQQADRQHLIASIKNAAAAAGLKEGFVDAARRAATPLIVDCIGLTCENLGDERFENELHQRMGWCKAKCRGDWEIEPIRQDGRLVGRRFRFGNVTEAVHFKLRFDTRL